MHEILYSFLGLVVDFTIMISARMMSDKKLKYPYCDGMTLLYNMRLKDSWNTSM